MPDYTITMSKDLDNVPVEKLTKICKFLGGECGEVDGQTFVLEDPPLKPVARSVNTAFAKYELFAFNCLAID